MNKKIKVLFLHPPLYPINHKIFNELGKYVDLTILSIGEYPKFHKNWKIDLFKIQNLNYKLKLIGKNSVNLKNQLNLNIIKEIYQEKPDVVVSIAFWIPSLYAVVFKNIFNYKFLIYTDAIYYTDKNISFLKKILRKLICKNSDGIISASKLTTEYIKNLCSNVKIYESVHVIDIKEWQKNLNELPDKSFLRKELGIPIDKKVLLGVGNFIELKNWETVFYNIKELDIYFILVGGGKLKDKYIKVIEDLNIKEKVKILDRKEGKELHKYFKSSDIFIFPTLKDTFGFVILEALASGLPVICSNRSGASSLIKNGYNGYIIEPDKEYKKEIMNAINNLDELSQNALMSIRNFSVENKVQDLVKIFKKVLESDK